MALLNPTPYKISTITATGGVNSIINLEVLYNQLCLIHHEETNDGFIYIEYGRKKSDTIHRGYNRKHNITRRKKVEAKRFDNQATIIYKHAFQGKQHFVNVKVFKNGNIQMTGIKQFDQCTTIIDKLIHEIRIIYNIDSSIVESLDNIQNVNNKIRLINSDFRAGIDIKRDKLYKLLQCTYGVFCSYEPCIYPGAKVQFYWNEIHNKQDGVCKCTGPCSGKGAGSGDGECKKITIAVFQSGCIIITGAQTHQQIDDAYKFICKVLQDNIEEVQKKPIIILEAGEVHNVL